MSCSPHVTVRHLDDPMKAWHYCGKCCQMVAAIDIFNSQRKKRRRRRRRRPVSR